MNRVKPIDISILSAHMGHIQTAVVAAVVVGLALHAWFTRSSVRDDEVLTIAIDGDADRMDPLVRLIARRTSRVTDVESIGGMARADLVVMPSLEFTRRRDELALVALFGLEAAPGDRALLVAAPGHTGLPRRIDEVLFSGPASVNGCWVQLSVLDGNLAVPATVDSLRFVPGADAARVPWAVARGDAGFGACRASDLDGADTLAVVLEQAALPEWIIAARPEEAPYFRERLAPLADAFADPGAHSDELDLVELLAGRGLGSFRGISPGQWSRLEEAGAVMERLTEGRGAGSP